MTRTRLHPGTFQAHNQVVLSLFHGNQQLHYRTIQPNNHFDVPYCANGHHYYLVYFPEFGDAKPGFHQVKND